LLKELQSLGLDVRVLREDQTEVEIMESIDYGENDYRYELEGDSKNYDYERDSFGAMGYQKQEFDEGSGELINSEEEDEAEDDLDLDTDLDDFGDNEEI
jgi:DNA-directed RNA polymerase subunit beta